MANPVSGITQTQQAAEIQAAQNAQNTPKQAQQQGTNPAAPEDTISPQGHAASQAQAGQPQKTSGDIDHDGYNQ
jgi:hypothetical protein